MLLQMQLRRNFSIIQSKSPESIVSTSPETRKSKVANGNLVSTLGSVELSFSRGGQHSRENFFAKIWIILFWVFRFRKESHINSFKKNAPRLYLKWHCNSVKFCFLQERQNTFEIKLTQKLRKNKYFFHIFKKYQNGNRQTKICRQKLTQQSNRFRISRNRSLPDKYYCASQLRASDARSISRCRPQNIFFSRNLGSERHVLVAAAGVIFATSNTELLNDFVNQTSTN